jgi:hypothetical protein
MKSLSVPFFSAEGLTFATVCAKSDIQAVEENIRELEDKRRRLERLIRTVERLRKSWKDEDPGKYGECRFLVSRAWLESTSCQLLVDAHPIDYFWVPEMADDPEAMRRGRKMDRRGDALVPVPLGTLDEAARRPCPHCRSDGLVVGCHDQPDDSQDGNDTWELNLSVLGPACLEETVFTRSVCSYRCLDKSARLTTPTG